MIYFRNLTTFIHILLAFWRLMYLRNLENSLTKPFSSCLWPVRRAWTHKPGRKKKLGSPASCVVVHLTWWWSQASRSRSCHSKNMCATRNSNRPKEIKYRHWLKKTGMDRSVIHTHGSVWIAFVLAWFRSMDRLWVSTLDHVARSCSSHAQYYIYILWFFFMLGYKSTFALNWHLCFDVRHVTPWSPGHDHWEPLRTSLLGPCAEPWILACNATRPAARPGVTGSETYIAKCFMY